MIDLEDGPDPEPDDPVDVYVGTVRHACGHSQQHFNCLPDELADMLDEPCCACRPQPAADFDDPFADYDTEGEE